MSRVATSCSLKRKQSAPASSVAARDSKGVVRGHQDNMGLAGPFAEATRGLQATHAGHAKVHQDQVGSQLIDGIEGLEPRRGPTDDLDPGQFGEQILGGVEERTAVIDEQEPVASPQGPRLRRTVAALRAKRRFSIGFKAGGRHSHFPGPPSLGAAPSGRRGSWPRGRDADIVILQPSSRAARRAIEHSCPIEIIVPFFKDVSQALPDIASGNC